MSGRQGSIDHDCSGARRGEKVMYIEDCQCRVVSELEKFRCGGKVESSCGDRPSGIDSGYRFHVHHTPNKSSRKAQHDEVRP